MPKPAGSGLLSGKREARLTTAPPETGTRPTTLRFEHARHMYFDGKQWLPSVTGIAGKAEDKTGLINWSAETVATCAIEEAAELSRRRRLDGDEAAHEWLSKAADRNRDRKAVGGSDLHDVADRMLSGMDMPEYLHEDIEKMARNVLAFMSDYSVEVLYSEVRLANRTLGYCGTTDQIGIVPVYGDKPIIIDWKTGESMYRRPQFSRGKNGMQLAAYRACEFMFWDDRTEADMIETDQVGLIVMIRPEGYKVEDYDLAQAWPQFERAIGNYHWWRSAESLARPARAPLALAVPVEDIHTSLFALLRDPACTREAALELYALHKDNGWTDEHMAVCLQRWPRKAA